MSKIDSPCIALIDFQDSYVRKDNFGMDFACSPNVSTVPIFYGSCWFRMRWLQNTFTEDITINEDIMPMNPCYIKDYKIR